MESNLNGKATFSIGAIFTGTLISLVSATVFSLIAATYLLITNITVLPTKWLFYLGILATAIGGCQAARRIKAKGWFHGALVGVLFLILSYLLFGLEGFIGHILWSKALITIIAGSIGGMFGMLFAR
ncbi:MAG: TIGR04086 family membrane protein [Limnochordia bacterium]|jgi:putative membrane protein (TIGR04086 family)|nr:TIGR04086 family membrane protein [Limnochordia bacterium]